MDTQKSLNDELTSFVNGSSVLVVIVSYQTGELVVDTLKSLTSEREEIHGLQVIVVDNTCGDDAPVIQSSIDENNWEEWVTIKISPRNGGFSFGNNLAIRSALQAKEAPKYIWLLNPDTQVYPGAGLELVKFLDDETDAGIAGSCLHNHDGSEWGVAFRFPTITSELEQAIQFGPFSRLVKHHIVARKMGNESTQVDWLPGASLMIRKEVFNNAGLFDEGYFLYYEETDFCLNANRAGWKSWYVPASKVMHIAGQSTKATGTSASTKRLPSYMFDSRYYYFTKNHGYMYAIVADVARISGLLCNKVIKILRGEANAHHAFLLRDSIRNFAIFKIIGKALQL